MPSGFTAGLFRLFIYKLLLNLNSKAFLHLELVQSFSLVSVKFIFATLKQDVAASALMFLLEGCEQGKERERLREKDGGRNKDQPKRWKEIPMLAVFKVIPTGGY